MLRMELPVALLALVAATTCVGAVVALPLHTTGRYLVNASNQRVKLAAVNWYGAEEQDYVVAGLEYAALSDIAYQIRVMGFNAVRLPWSNQMVETNPVIDNSRLAANPSLVGQRALGVFDAVVAALANEGLLIILDNHMSNANWCCSDTDGNGLWYNAAFRNRAGSPIGRPWLAATEISRRLSAPTCATNPVPAPLGVAPIRSSTGGQRPGAVAMLCWRSIPTYSSSLKE